MVNKPFWQISNFVLASYTFGCVKMSDFVPNNRHLRKVLIFFFHSKKTAAEAYRELQKVYGDAALSETTCRDRFRRFKDGDFAVDDGPHQGRPKTFEDAHHVVYCELLKPNETITGDRYRTQMMRLSRALPEKRPQYEQKHEKVILQHENAWPHISKPVKTYLETHKWQVLPHPPYSPDIAPSDYYLFRSMAHGLADQQFRSYEGIEKWLDSWITSKDEHFYRNGIPALPEIWAKVVANDGHYFEWFIFNHFFTIKLRFHLKKQQELSCTPNKTIFCIIIWTCESYVRDGFRAFSLTNKS